MLLLPSETGQGACTEIEGDEVMACFLAPVAEAVVVSIVKHHVEKKEKADASGDKERHRIPFATKLGWLTKLLWGGSFLLALEHVWHDEVVLWPPFLTAMNDPADIPPMLMEIATAGVAMALLVTAAWVVMLLVCRHLENRAFAAKTNEG